MRNTLPRPEGVLCTLLFMFTMTLSFLHIHYYTLFCPHIHYNTLFCPHIHYDTLSSILVRNIYFKFSSLSHLYTLIGISYRCKFICILVTLICTCNMDGTYIFTFGMLVDIYVTHFGTLFGQIVMDDHQRPNGIPVTRFTLQSIYAQSDDEKLEFEYESGNTNILVGSTCILFK